MLHFQVKANGISVNAQGQEVGEIEAFGAIYGNIDDGNDRVIAGASKRTIHNSKTRAKSRNKDYILPMIWNHDTEHFMPLGGWYDVDGDNPEGLLGKAHVLLTTQAGREYYELAKAKMVDTFSVIYDIPAGGAKYDKSGVREITEWRIFSIDPVIFPMNDETRLVSVKSMEQKSVCGDTSLPIGPRNESWNGAKAKKQIFDYATSEDGTIDATKAKKCFLQVDGDTSLKGSYKYPFCSIENGSPRISVGGVKACAGALAGDRGASVEGADIVGMRKKVETLYARINKMYPDDPELEATWEDDGKSMSKPMQRKTLAEHYNQQMAKDLLEDWQDVFVCSLTCAIYDALTIGDQPEQDIAEALDAFRQLVLEKFVTQAVEVGLSAYLESNGYSYDPGLYTMHNGSDDDYSYMSRSTRMHQKAGRSISASNQAVIDEHVKTLKSTAKQAKADMQNHVDAMHDAIDGMAGGKSLGTPAHKAGRSLSATNADKLHDMTDKAMSIMQEHTKSIAKAANTLASSLSGRDEDGDSGNDEDEDPQLEKSFQNALSSIKALSA